MNTKKIINTNTYISDILKTKPMDSTNEKSHGKYADEIFFYPLDIPVLYFLL